MVQAVTGTGKSRVGVEAAREALRDDCSVVVCVPTVELVEQWIRSLKALGVPRVGRIAGEKRATLATHDVIVGTVQSLYRDPPQRYDGKVLLIADECHRYGAREWSAILHDTYRRRLGLTATFERSDDGLTTLLHYFGGGPVFDIDFSRAIEEGVIAHYNVKLVGVSLAPSERSIYDEADRVLSECRQELVMDGVSLEPFGVFMHEVAQIADDQTWHPLQEAARRYLKEFSRRAEVVSNAQAKFEVMDHISPLIGSSNGALVFTRRVDTSEDLAARLVATGVAAKPIHSDLTRTERQERMAELRRGSIKALVAPTVLDEGVDVPEIDVAVVMGGSKSRRQMIQRMGRVLRLKKSGGRATFVVVYAKNTVEDITMNSGVEGCLDLITASADTVQHLNPKTLEEVGAVVVPSPAPVAMVTGQETGGGGALESAVARARDDEGAKQEQALVRTLADSLPAEHPPSPTDVPDPLGSADTSEPEAARDDDQGAPATAPFRPDLAAVSLTRVVLDHHIEAHGGDLEGAAAEIAQMVEDFGSRARWSRNDADHHVVRRAEYTLVVDATGSRFIRYRSGRGRMTWMQFKAREDDVVWAQRPVLVAGKRLAPIAWADPSEFVTRVDPESVCITISAFRQAAKMLGLFGQSVDDDTADHGIRKALATALARSRLAKADEGVVCSGGDGIDWVLSPDGCTVIRVKRGDGAEAPSHETAEVDAQTQRHSVPVTAVPPPATPLASAPRHRATSDVASIPQTHVDAGLDLVTQIERLATLRNEGLLTDEEFSAAKARLIF